MLYSPSRKTKKMRVNFDKKHYTKAERIFGEILKRNRIPFRAKVVVQGREIDFLLREKIAVEIGNHSQDKLKNKLLLESGLSLLFISNKELYESPSLVEKHLLENWLLI